MNETNHAIFRTRAVRRYLEERERAVLPRFVSPRAFLALWILLGLLAGAGAGAWTARVPVYAAGPAVALERPGHGGETDGSVLAAAFLPAEYRLAVRPGQTILLDLRGTGTKARRPIATVEPEVMSPSTVRSRFRLPPALAGTITGPVVLVIVDPAPLPPELPASAYAGSVYQAEVQVSSRRLLSLVPLIGPAVGG